MRSRRKSGGAGISHAHPRDESIRTHDVMNARRLLQAITALTAWRGDSAASGGNCGDDGNRSDCGESVGGFQNPGHLRNSDAVLGEACAGVDFLPRWRELDDPPRRFPGHRRRQIGYLTQF